MDCVSVSSVPSRRASSTSLRAPRRASANSPPMPLVTCDPGGDTGGLRLALRLFLGASWPLGLALPTLLAAARHLLLSLGNCGTCLLEDLVALELLGDLRHLTIAVVLGGLGIDLDLLAAPPFSSWRLLAVGDSACAMAGTVCYGLGISAQLPRASH